MAESLRVCWNNFNGAVSESLGDLQQKQEFVDMTLSAEGHLVKVHQLVISLASPYLKEIIKAAPCPHPVIHLYNISFKTLSNILEYIYCGEVTLLANNMHEFFNVARALSIRGLQHLESISSLCSFETENDAKKNPEETPTIQTNVVMDVDSDQIPSKKQKLNLDETSPQKSPFSTLIQKPLIANVLLLKQNKMNTTATKRASPPTPTKPSKNIPENVESSLKSQELQYTVSNRGSLQLILNRYLYNSVFRQKSSGRIRWQCVDRRDYNCPAHAVTTDGVVVARTGIHNHPFHDRRILTKIDKKIVFTDLEQLQNSLKSSNDESSQLELTDSLQQG